MGEGITPELATVILAAVDSKLLDVHTMLPVRVEASDQDKNTVDVVPQIKRMLEKADGSLVAENLPKLANVPVAFYRAGPFSITVPVAKGNYGSIIVSEAALDQWRATGEVQVPGDVRRFSLGSAMYYPGLYPSSEPAEATDDSMVIAGPKIQFGSKTAVDGIVLDSLMLAELVKIAAAVGGGYSAPLTVASSKLLGE